jgi:hypothetical protein
MVQQPRPAPFALEQSRRAAGDHDVMFFEFAEQPYEVH